MRSLDRGKFLGIVIAVVIGAVIRAVMRGDEWYLIAIAVPFGLLLGWIILKVFGMFRK